MCRSGSSAPGGASPADGAACAPFRLFVVAGGAVAAPSRPGGALRAPGGGGGALGGGVGVPSVALGAGGGAGGAGGALGQQHSQSLEAQYVHIPGLKVMMPATPYDAKGMLKTAIRDPDPVIFIESEILFGAKGEVPEEEYLIPMGKGDIKREGSDCTIIAWSRMVHVAKEAAEILSAEGIEVEILDPRTLRPLDKDLIRQSVKKTNRCVVAEEGWYWASVGSTIADFVSRDLFDWLDAPVERVYQADVPMPYAFNLEEFSLPNAERVAEAVRRACYRNR